MTKTLNGRQKARRLGVQALYCWAMSDNALGTLLDDIFETSESEEEPVPVFFQGFDEGYLNRLIRKLPTHVSEIDNAMVPFLSRSIEALNPVEHAILRIAFYELIYCPDVPYKVVINEAIDLAKEFGAEQSHKFVNGVLDKAARSLRSK